DPDLVVGDELVGRQRQIRRRRPATDAARRVVLRAMARAEPAVEVALMRQRDAAKVGADADQHQPLVLALLDPRLIGLRVREGVPVEGTRLVDLFLGAMTDEDRLAAPEHFDDLPFGNWSEIDLDRRPS